MKKFIYILLAMLQMLLCLSGCGNASSLSDDPNITEDTITYTVPSTIPVFEDNAELQMIAFWSPPSTLEHYQWMVDSGMTAVVIDSKYGNSIDSSELMKTLELCDQVGIKAYISQLRESVLRFSCDYSQYSSFAGFYTDEPCSLKEIENVEQSIEVLNNRYPDKNYQYLTTLWPLHSDDFGSLEAFYQTYMDHGGSKQNSYMYDIYPLQVKDGKGWINPDWLYTLEVGKDVADKNGVELWPYLATMSYSNRRRPEEKDMRYTSYVNLAYGVTGLGYFCYMSPGIPPYDGEFGTDDWAMVYYENPSDLSTYYRTDTWYVVQKVNNELKAFDHVLLSFEWLGVMKSAGSDASTTAGKNCFLNAKKFLKRYDGVKSVSSTEDAILGVFQDENGYDGYMLVNFSDTFYDRSNNVTIEFRGANRAVVYIKGEKNIVDLKNGTYSVTLEPGEGQFIIPLS